MPTLLPGPFALLTLPQVGGFWESDYGLQKTDLTAPADGQGIAHWLDKAADRDLAQAASGLQPKYKANSLYFNHPSLWFEDSRLENVTWNEWDSLAGQCWIVVSRHHAGAANPEYLTGNGDNGVLVSGGQPNLNSFGLATAGVFEAFEVGSYNFCYANFNKKADLSTLTKTQSAILNLIWDSAGATDADKWKLYRNGQQLRDSSFDGTVPADSSVLAPGIRVGNGGGGDTAFIKQEIVAIVHLKFAPTPVQLASYNQYFEDKYFARISDQSLLVIGDDSIPEGYPVTLDNLSPYWKVGQALNANIFRDKNTLISPSVGSPSYDVAKPWNVISTAVRAETYDLYVGLNAPTNVDTMYDENRANNVLFTQFGTNDLAFYVLGMASGKTAPQVIADKIAYRAAREAVGWKVIDGTLLPRDDGPGFPPEITVNNATTTGTTNVNDAGGNFIAGYVGRAVTLSAGNANEHMRVVTGFVDANNLTLNSPVPAGTYTMKIWSVDKKTVDDGIVTVNNYVATTPDFVDFRAVPELTNPRDELNMLDGDYVHLTELGNQKYADAIVTAVQPVIPVANFTISATIQAGDSLIPDNTSTGADTYEWRVAPDNDNAVKSTAFEPQLAPDLKNGTFEIELKAINGANVSTIRKTVTVNSRLITVSYPAVQYVLNGLPAGLTLEGKSRARDVAGTPSEWSDPDTATTT